MKPDTFDFRPAWWLPGPHLQTVWGRLARGRRLVPLRREVLETPDGDELVLDHTAGPDGAPRVILLHGLEGSSHSVYIQGLLAALARQNLRATAVNFRSCARDPDDLSRIIPNRRPRLYHSGETEDLDFVARAFASREPDVPIGAIGVSLGGNVLLKWLGEPRPGARPIAAAVAISTPYDLAASAQSLERGLGRLYTEGFLRTLRAKALEAARRFPEAAARIDVPRTKASRTFWEFDDSANAPLHGFAGADDYYARCSSLRFLPSIATPTLCLSAEDDPFLPREALARARWAASPAVELVTTAKGGHIGWVSGTAPWAGRYPVEERAVSWMAARLSG